MTTCLELDHEFLPRIDGEKILLYCGLFGLIEDLFDQISRNKIRRIEYLLTQVDNINITINGPIPPGELIDRMISRAKEIAAYSTGTFELQRAARTLLYAIEGEGSFDEAWYQFSHRYYSERLALLKK